jgi:hypothetical protein
LAPLYDQIFRRHLRDACSEVGVEPPVDLSQPLKTVTRTIRVPVTSQWRPPSIDGKITNYFEWSLATWIEAPNGDPMRHLAMWATPEAIYLLVQSEVPFSQLLATSHLVIRLIGETGETVEARFDADGRIEGNLTLAVGPVVEAEIPWTPSGGMRLEIRIADRLVTGSTLLLEPYPVDEEYSVGPGQDR